MDIESYVGACLDIHVCMCLSEEEHVKDCLFYNSKIKLLQENTEWKEGYYGDRRLIFIDSFYVSSALQFFFSPTATLQSKF